MPTTPPTITPLPNPPDPNDRSTYNARAYPWSLSQQTLATEFGAVAANVYDNATEALDAASTATTEAVEAATAAGTATTKAAEASVSASTASTKASEASTSASTASTAASTASSAAGTATTAAGTATTKAAEASVSAAQAQVFATQQLKASSTSNLVPGAGPKTFMVEPGRSFVKGMYLVATSIGAAVNQMSGPVDSYDGATGALALLVDAFTGAAARADWVIGVAVAATAAGLPVVPVFENTVAVAGVCYQIAAPGITLTMPTVWAKGQRTAIVELIRNNQKYTVVWGCKLRGQTLGTRIYSATGVGSGVLEFQDNDKGLT